MIFLLNKIFFLIILFNSLFIFFVTSTEISEIIFSLIFFFILFTFSLISLGFDFLAWISFIIYLGAVIIFFIFILMTLNQYIFIDLKKKNKMHSFGFSYYIFFIFLFFLQLYFFFLDFYGDLFFFNERVFYTKLETQNPLNVNITTNLETLGNLLYINQIDNLFLFSIILLVALIGSFWITEFKQ